MPPLSLTVVVPTYQRPEWIGRAVGSLAGQTRPPDQVVAVARDTDTPTHDAVAALQARLQPFPLELGLVAQPGFMPPVARGIALARGDVIAVMDDDAEALPDWAGRLLSHYADPSVLGVGGRVINVNLDGSLRDEGVTDDVGRLDALGRPIGNMYKEPRFTEPVDVDFMMGGCMSYRAAVARALEFDGCLNRGVALGYELDLGLQVRRRGGRLLFDPRAAIRHYSAPRAVTGSRDPSDAEAVNLAAYNETRVLLRRLPPGRAAVAAAFGMGVGSRR